MLVSTKMVLAISPPIVARASAFQIVASMVSLNRISGSRPTTVVSVVIRMGRTRSSVPWMIASLSSFPARRISLM